MKKITKTMVSVVAILLLHLAPIFAFEVNDSLVLQLLQETKNEIQQTNQGWSLKINQLQFELAELDELMILKRTWSKK
jgi:hypothetical protein